MTRPSFQVDGTHLGRSEAEWAASPHLGKLSALQVPSCAHAVIVAPHPDDEILGAGGLAQVLAEQTIPLDVCAVTDGEAARGVLDPDATGRLKELRTAESEEALARIGLDPARRYRLGVADGKVSEDETELGSWLDRHLGTDSLLVAPWSHDGHPDHDATGRVAAAVAGALGIPCLYYPVWAWHWASPHGEDLPWTSSRSLDLTRRQAARKRWATMSFRTQILPPTTPADATAVLPPPVMRRFWRRWELYIT